MESKNNHVVRKHAFHWRYDTAEDPVAASARIGLLSAEDARAVQARIDGVNPADLTRRINQIQLQLIELSRDRTQAMTASRHLDMASLEPSIRRLQTTK